MSNRKFRKVAEYSYTGHTGLVNRVMTIKPKRQKKEAWPTVRKYAVRAFMAGLISGCALFFLVNGTSASAPPLTAELVVVPVANEVHGPVWQAQETMIDAIGSPLPMVVQDELFNQCERFDIPYELALALIDVESDFTNKAGDGGDSIGYMQVQPRWHMERMQALGATDLWAYKDNFTVGLSYLAELIYKYEDCHMALMAYNMGETGAATHWGNGVYTSTYSRKVMECAGKWVEIGVKLT